MLQEFGVAVIVLAAVAFLARRFFGGSRKPKKAATFVPLSQLKKKPKDNCH